MRAAGVVPPDGAPVVVEVEGGERSPRRRMCVQRFCSKSAPTPIAPRRLTTDDYAVRPVHTTTVALHTGHPHAFSKRRWQPVNCAMPDCHTVPIRNPCTPDIPTVRSVTLHVGRTKIDRRGNSGTIVTLQSDRPCARREIYRRVSALDAVQGYKGYSFLFAHKLVES